MTKHALLIHGAWQGAWVWDTFTPCFEALGWRCKAVDLPENGQPGSEPGPASLTSYVDHCASVMEGASTIIAHSGAGVVASRLAETLPERVEAVVYVAGMMLPSGMAFEDLLADWSGEPISKGIGPHLVWSPDGAFSAVPPEAALEIFLQDCPADAARAAAARLTPQRESGRRLRAHLTPERFGRVRRIYVEALRDRSVVLAVQRRMQALSPGAEVLSIDTGHAPQLAAPNRLASMLDGALSKTSA